MIRLQHYSRHTASVLTAVVLACTSGPAVTPVVPVDQVTVSPTTLMLLVGGQQTLTATPMGKGEPLTGRTVSWSSGNAAIATVGTGGQVTAVAAGNTVITASSDGINGTATVAVNNPVPTVSAMAPTTAAATSPAFLLTVTGTGFVTGSTVQWNGAAVPTTVVSSTSLTASIPAADILAAGSATVTVFTPAPGGGTAGNQPFTISAAPNPAPTIASLAPNSTPAGGAAFTLTINGSNFVAASQATWNGTSRTTTFVSATQLHVAILAGDIAGTGTAQLTVVNPAPGGGTSGTLPFAITQLLPAITTLLPNTIVSGSPPLLVSVIGSNFVAGSQVQWNGVARTTTFVSATQLTALVTAADIATNATAQITVNNPGASGGTSSAKAFTVDTPPEISIGGTTSCGFKPGAPVYCWGTGANYFNGTGLTPAAASGALVFHQIGAASDHICGLAASGAAYCWGSGSDGDLGDGNATFSATPVAVAGGLTWSMIATGAGAGGGGRSCGLTLTGTAYCWGLAGFAIYSTNAVPVMVSGAPAFVSITLGDDHTCALTSGGTAYCWGSRHYGGEIGDGGGASNTDQSTPVQVSGNHTFIAISAGGWHTCALEVGGAIWCWGAVETAAGSLGNGSGYGYNVGSLVPVLVTGGHIFQSVSAGFDHTCALDPAGTAWCWGEGAMGVLGQGVASSSNVPVAVAGGKVFRSIAAGGPTCGVITSGAVYCWGAKSLLGIGDPAITPVPVPVSGGLTFTDIAISLTQTCGLTSAAVIGTPVGTTYCWGTARSAGDPTQTDESTPKLLAGAPLFVALSNQEGANICGRTAASAIYCWGATPTLFGAPVQLASVSTSVTGSVCGLSASGALYCAGSLYSGGPTFTPQTAAFPGTSFTAVSLGSDIFCGILATNAMQCVGNGAFGGLGNGSFASTTTLGPVSGGLSFASTASSSEITCAVTTGGTGYCFGGTLTNLAKVPVAVAGGLTFASIDVSYWNACGVTTSNAAFCWGYGEHVELLGTNAATFTNVPAAVQGPAMSKIRVGQYHVCGLTPLGAAWCWGDEDVGELGNGVLGYIPVPTLVSW